MEREVEVWGKSCVVKVHQKSKSVWVANGDFNGEPITVQGSSWSAAVASWREAARYKGNG